MKKWFLGLITALATGCMLLALTGCDIFGGKEHTHRLAHYEEVPATCTQTGVRAYWRCADCEKYYLDEECSTEAASDDLTIPPSAHIEVIDEKVEPTCTETGLSEGKHCSVCKTVLVAQKVVPANGHTVEIDEGVEPTCTQTGVSQGSHCSVCKTVLVAQEEVPASGHLPVTVKRVEPTCTQTGLTAGESCAVCKTVLIAQEEIPIVEHTETMDRRIEPTCTQTGLSEGKHCSACKTVLVAQTTLPVIDHSYNKDLCSVCGIHKPTEGLQYALSSDKTYAVVSGIGTATDTEIYISNSYQGVLVKEVRYNAFYNHSELTKVVIPDSVTKIGQMAFTFCQKMTSVEMGKGLIEIGDWAFQSCTALKSIVIPDSVTKIGYNAFGYCSGLTSLTIGKNVDTISNVAFSGCSGLTSITVKNGNSKYHSAGNCLIETQAKTLFLGCKKSIIPKDGSVTVIGQRAFGECSELTSIAIPDTVTVISNYAFLGCIGLTKVVIPDKVYDVAQSAFQGCSGLKSVTLPKSILYLGSHAFKDCSSLTLITYSGTRAEWNAIDKWPDWSDGMPSHTLRCSDGDITE